MMHQVNRRQFVSMTAAGVSAALANPNLIANESSSPGWIDAHVHVWSPDTAKYPISNRFQKSEMQPPSFTAKELFSHCKPEGVNRIVLIQMSFYEHDHRYMNEVIAEYPGVFSGVAIVDHHADDLLAKMKEVTSQGSRGFRVHSHGDAKDWGDDPGMAKLWQEAAKNGWAVCPLINPSELSYVDTLCKKFPETTVVVDHFARVGISGEIKPEELEALCRLARFKQVHVKTSAFYALGKKSSPYEDLTEMIKKVIDAFGPERLMWASDCPYQVQGEHTYAASISLVRDRLSFLSASDKEWLLRKTAEKVFFN